MSDIFDKAKRSEIMSHVKSKNTKPEVALRKALFARGFRYRINDKRLAGKPDIVFPKYRTVIFVNGCFWHGHEGCKHYRIPHSNQAYWENKISKNIERDNIVKNELIRTGWRVIVIWECEITSKSTLDSVAEKIAQTLF